MGYGKRKCGRFTVCGCNANWMYNDKIESWSRCSRCGDSFQAAKARYEAANSSPREKDAKDSKNEVRKQKEAARAAGNDSLLALLDKAYPTGGGPSAEESEPIKALNAAHHAVSKARSKSDKAVERAATLQVQLEAAEKEAAQALAAVTESEESLAKAKEQYAASSGPAASGGSLHPGTSPDSSQVLEWVRRMVPSELAEDRDITAALAEASKQLQQMVAAVATKVKELPAAKRLKTGGGEGGVDGGGTDAGKDKDAMDTEGEAAEKAKVTLEQEEAKVTTGSVEAPKSAEANAAKEAAKLNQLAKAKKAAEELRKKGQGS